MVGLRGLVVYYRIACGLQWNMSWEQAANQRAGEVMRVDMEQVVKDEASVEMETCSFNTNEQKQQKQHSFGNI